MVHRPQRASPVVSTVLRHANLRVIAGFDDHAPAHVNVSSSAGLAMIELNAVRPMRVAGMTRKDAAVRENGKKGGRPRKSG
jgi:hypothetical protein